MHQDTIHYGLEHWNDHFIILKQDHFTSYWEQNSFSTSFICHYHIAWRVNQSLNTLKNKRTKAAVNRFFGMLMLWLHSEMIVICICIHILFSLLNLDFTLALSKIKGVMSVCICINFDLYSFDCYLFYF